MDILSQDFEDFREQFHKKMEEVRKSFEEMEQKYKECEDFSIKVLKPKQWCIEEKLKNQEQELLGNYRNAIDKWKKAVKDFNVFCKEHLGLI